MLATTTDKRLRLYWLRQLNESEMAAIEQRYFADRDFFLEVEAAAEKLADEYAQGGLGAAERGVVEALAESPEWKLRLELARQRRG